MVGGVKAYYAVLLALVLGVGCASSQYPSPPEGHGSHNEHHGHNQAPPLLEMLPPIGPIGFVLIGVVSDLNHWAPRQVPHPASLRWNPTRPPEPDGWADRQQDTNGS